MKKEFHNTYHVACIFTDEGISFFDNQQEVYFPYGCIDSLNISLLGILQATCRARVCSFAVDRKDRAEVKQMMKYAREAMKTAPKAEPVITDLSKTDLQQRNEPGLSVEEQLKQFKALFVQGAISKEEYDARKRQLKEE